MKKLKAIFFNGWCIAESMIEPQWFPVWLSSVKENEQKGYKTVVFRVPASHEVEAIHEIETLLQNKFPNEKGN